MSKKPTRKIGPYGLPLVPEDDPIFRQTYVVGFRGGRNLGSDSTKGNDQKRDDCEAAHRDGSPYQDLMNTSDICGIDFDEDEDVDLENSEI